MKIIFLEEKQSEIRIYESILEDAHISFEGRVVKTENEFIKQVNHFNPDVILSGYSLSKYSVNEALEYLRDQELHIPFVFITGSISEEMARSYLEKGVDDYVPKTNLFHLPVVIKNAVAKRTAEREKREADMMRKISEEKLRDIFENDPECIFHVGFNGEILEMNPAASILTGLLSETKLKKVKMWDFVSKPELKKLKSNHQSICRGKKKEFTFTFTNSKGANFLIETVGIPLYDSDKNVTASLLIGRNITQQDEALKELRIAQSNFNALIENINENVWSIDSNYCLVSFNKFYSESYKKNLGVHPKPGNLVYRDIPAAVSGVFVEKWKTHYDCALAGEQFSFVDTSLIKKEPTYYQISLYPIKINGKITGVSCISTNITQIKKNKIELRKSEEKFRTLAENSPIAIYQADALGNCFYVNIKWTELTGFTFEEAMGQGWVNALHPEDKERVIEEWKNSASGGTAFHSEFRYLSKDGKAKWVSGNAVTIKDPNGEISGFIGTLEDITEKKQAEINFYHIFDNSPDAIYIEDAEGIILSANREACKFQGMTLEELKGKNILDLAPPEKGKEIKADFEKLYKEEISRLKSTTWNRNGTIIPIEIHSRKIIFNDTPALLLQVRELLNQ